MTESSDELHKMLQHDTNTSGGSFTELIKIIKETWIKRSEKEVKNDVLEYIERADVRVQNVYELLCSNDTIRQSDAELCVKRLQSAKSNLIIAEHLASEYDIEAWDKIEYGIHGTVEDALSYLSGRVHSMCVMAKKLTSTKRID